MARKIRFGLLTLDELNPDNNSLKNDYIDNMMHMAINVSGIIPMIEGAKFRRCMVAKHKLKKPDRFERYHLSGSAIALRYDPALVDINKIILKEFIKNSEGFSVAITDSDYIFVYDRKSALYEKTPNGYRTVYKKA